MTKEQEILNLKAEVENLKNQIEEYHHREIMFRKLGTQSGFFKYYFEKLPEHRTQVECFNSINNAYLEFFGIEKFSNYDSFRKAYN